MPRRKGPKAGMAVRALILSLRGEVLLIRDRSDKRSPDRWQTPGMWLGDAGRDGARMRQLVKDRLRIDIIVDKRPCDPVYDGDTRIEYLIFSAHPAMDMPAPQGKIWSAGWFTRDELRWNWDSIHDETRVILKAAGVVEGA